MRHKIKRIVKNFLKPKVLPYNNVVPKIVFHGGLIQINDTQPEDVFIVGFPKSGNTLMQHIIAHLVYGLNEEGSRSIINLIAPDIYASSHYFRFNDVCYFKSHERPQPHYKKVIYLLRDGREALLSYHHMMKNMGKEVSLNDLYSGNIKIYGGLWHEHIEDWKSNPYNADILFVRFENLKNDKLQELKRICNFLKIERSNTELKKVVQLTSFNHMKSLEQRTDWKNMKKEVLFKTGNFVRKGELKSYINEVPEELIRKFEKASKNSFYSFV